MAIDYDDGRPEYEGKDHLMAERNMTLRSMHPVELSHRVGD